MIPCLITNDAFTPKSSQSQIIFTGQNNTEFFALIDTQVVREEHDNLLYIQSTNIHEQKYEIHHIKSNVKKSF